MRINLFQKVLRLEEGKAAYKRKGVVSKRRKKALIPDGYYIEVITTIPGRKPVVEKD